MATVTGTAGNDTLTGTAGNDTISGLGGNDLIRAGSTGGTDVINGGAGFDSIEFASRATSAVVVDFGAGTISGGSSGTIRFSNVERVVAGTFNDSLTGNAAGQNLTGQAGADTLWGAGGIDTLWGGGGADTFIFREVGTANADRISDWTSGSDKLLLDASVMSALGANGNFAAGDARFWSSASGAAHDADDRIIFNTTTRQVFYDADGNGSGTARLIATLQSGATLVATDIVVEGGSSGGGINGTAGDDSLVGTAGNDTINGLAGNDTLDGRAGDDSLLGGDGDDRLQGGTGSDTLEGGAGLDVLEDGDGDNVLRGGAGNDVLVGGRGDDSLAGGDGNDFFSVAHFNGSAADAYGHDTIEGGAGVDSLGLGELVFGSVIIDLAAGTLRGADPGSTGSASLSGIENASTNRFGGRITGDAAANSLAGGDGSDTLEGGGGDDTLSGGPGFGGGANVLLGGTGNDRLIGDNGVDTLDGGAGDDRLETRGSGADSLVGGDGSDLFVLGREFSGAFGVHRLADFVSGSDTIQLENSRMPHLGPEGRLVAGDARFHAGAGATAAHDADDRIIYDTSTGELYFDPDGSGNAAAAQLIARLEGAPGVVANDIVVGDGEPGGTSRHSYRTALDNGASANRIDIVIAGDRYTEDQLDTDYAAHVDSLISYMFDDGLLTQPFGRYESFFNIHIIDAVSTESSTALGSVYTGSTWLVSENNTVVLEAMGGSGIAPDFRWAAINDARFGGSWDGAWATFSARNTLANEIALHEAGHGIGKLADEYWTAGTTWTFGEPFFPNVTADPTAAKWSRWLGYDQPGIGVIGAYEGGFLHEEGIYRPSQHSKMNTTQSPGNPFDAVGREAFILEFYELVDPLDAYLANTATLENEDEFWVDTIDPDVILVDWTVNGTTFTNAGERISLSDLGYDEGEFTVTARAYDPTDWVRFADRSSLEQTVQWNVVNGTPSSGQVINGTAGNDTLAGTAGNDTINGLGGNDLVLAGSSGGADVINGGAGSDSIEFASRATSAVVVDFGCRHDHGGSSGTISFTGIERVVASTFNDSLTGNAAGQILTGQAGADTLWGAGGNDTLWGGGGADTFIFRETGSANADSVRDWASGSDKVALDNSPMSALGAMGNFAAGDGRFWAAAGATAGHDANDRVVYNTSTGSLYYDADGSGAGAAQLIATFQGNPAVSATDIVVI